MVKRGVILVALILWSGFASAPIWAARIFVPELELFLRARLFDDNSSFQPQLETLANLKIDIEASDKIGAKIRLGHSGNISRKIAVGGQLINQLISLDLISLTVGEPFETPLYVELFSGQHDKIGSGDDFERLFNVDGVTSFFRGYLYFNENALYDALHTIDGTGLVLASEFGSDFASARLYLYKDTPTYRLVSSGSGSNSTVTAQELDTGSYSADLRTMFDADRVQIDFYVGATFNTIENSLLPLPLYSLRTGLMANFGLDELFQFFVHVGVPYLVELEKGELNNLSISHLQILAEPRFNIGDVFGLHLTFLATPFRYNNRIYSDPGVSINAKLFFGSYNAELGRGGFDIRTNFDSSFAFENLSVIPFFGFTAGGIVWDLGGNFQVIPLNLNQFLSSLNITISAKAVF